MYNDNLAHVIEFEYDNLVQNDTEMHLVTDSQRYCPMCDDIHANQTYCQAPYLEAV